MLYGSVNELLHLGKFNDFIELLDDLSTSHPEYGAIEKNILRPLNSGWKPVPTSSRLPTWPWISACPSVGSVIRERTFSSVLFPAPFRPITPTTSPRLISKEMSFNAQKGSSFPFPFPFGLNSPAIVS